MKNSGHGARKTQNGVLEFGTEENTSFRFMRPAAFTRSPKAGETKRIGNLDWKK